MEWLLDDPVALQRRDRWRKRHGKVHLWKPNTAAPVSGIPLSYTECNKWYDRDIVTRDVASVTCRRCLHVVPKTGGRAPRGEPRSRSIPASAAAVPTKKKEVCSVSGNAHTCDLLPGHTRPDAHHCPCGKWWSFVHCEARSDG